ncbi:hypothetical protein [Nocardioides sp. TF02-7]|uniref:hypothetical protein n=1 Tax=Nocardioides sp. TF02-7 TaxID=2917724 RepID=UPI001F063CB3|nr:hypothetical protein [Nocardioides sp. TF02-7]UMG91848.1 hypothetical protein MF408_17645 [Nocardioides sp. TF02-7]
MFRSLSILTALLLSATGCALLPDDDPEALADDLAEALSSHSLAELPLTRDADRDRHAELVDPLDGQEPEVTVAGVDVDGDTAEVTLRWAWSFPPQDVALHDDGPAGRRRQPVGGRLDSWRARTRPA